MRRLIVFIVVCALFLTFIAFNLDNKSNISIGFRTFVDIPVFLIAFSSFLLGMLFAVPFVLSFGRGKKKSPKAESSDIAPLIPVDEPFPGNAKKEKSPYGID